MIRTLVIIAVASFVLALACFAGAAALGGRELAANGWVWPEKWQNYGIRISDASPGARTVEEVRKLQWTGSDTLQIDMPGTIRFVQGEQPEVNIEGPVEIISGISLVDGRLFQSDESASAAVGRSDEVEITIVAPSVRRFVVNGSPNLKVTNYDQENLTVEINGSGSAEVEGRTDRLAVTVSGSGEADLGAVQVGDANIKVVGSGEATAAPTGRVKVEIAGSGDVRLTSKPTSLESQIDGSGDLHTAD